MTLPSQETIAQTIFDSGNVPDPDEIFLALEDMERRIAKKLINQLTNPYPLFLLLISKINNFLDKVKRINNET